MNVPDDVFATAVHEASHAIAADRFKIPACPELTPDGVSQLTQQTMPGVAGLCHLEDPVTKFQSAVICWSGPMGQAMFASTPDWMPPFRPSEKMLRDWFSMVRQQVHRLSDGDRRGIILYKDTWRACRSAFAILRKNRARIIRLAKALTQAKIAADREADARLWAGVPRPPGFPATHADFVRLVCSNNAVHFEQFILSRAALHLTNGSTTKIEDAKVLLEASFDDAFAISMNLQRGIYAGSFTTADSWLKAARDFQQWVNDKK